MHILINTCLKYYDKTIPQLLDNLVTVGGVPSESIIVIIGETPSNYIEPEPKHQIKHYYVPYANMDNNALIWASKQEKSDDWYFYLHDTCSVTNGFYKNILNQITVLKQNGYLAAKIYHPYSMCIGLYSQEALCHEKIREDLEYNTNLDLSPEKILAIKRNLKKLEDHVFRIIQLYYGNQAVWTYPNIQQIIEKDALPYKTDIKRIYEYYSNPGIIKMKANWGQGDLHINL